MKTSRDSGVVQTYSNPASASLVLSTVLTAVPVKANPVINYGDITLSGGFQSGNFPHIWNLTACDLVITFTVDLTGVVDDFGGGAHAWSELGVRDTSTTSNFNQGTWITGGKGVWLATDYHWTANTFDPDPPSSRTLDIDDKLILQRGGGADESYYDLPSTPPDPWTNYGIWSIATVWISGKQHTGVRLMAEPTTQTEGTMS